MSVISKNILLNAVKVTDNVDEALALVARALSPQELSKAKRILKKEPNLDWHNINEYI